LNLAAEEAGGKGHFFSKVHGREQKYELKLVLAVREVPNLYKALVDEGIEAVVQAAHAGFNTTRGEGQIRDVLSHFLSLSSYKSIPEILLLLNKFLSLEPQKRSTAVVFNS
jgi:hypothetical protein